MNRILLYWFILFVLVSCASQEKAISSQTSGISTKDYPYISKFHSAVRLKTKGRVEEAIATFEECLTMRQDDDAVYYALSQLEMSRENYQKSAEYTLKAAEIDPNNTWYIQELAYMYFELKDYEKAVENFEKLTQKEPRNVEWQYGYAEALVYTGEKAKAIEALNKTEDQVGVNPELSIQKYNLFMEMNKSDEALRELQQAREKFPRDLQLLGTTVEHYFATGKEQEGIKLLEELVEQDPNNGRAHLALADVYRQQGKQKESFLELKLAFKAHDVDIDTKMKILINFHESMYDLNPELYELVDLMIEIYPNEAKAHSIRGDYLLREGKDDEALISYSKALEFDKSQYPIWNQVLIMEYQARDYNALYDHSSECLTLFPTMTTVYLLKGVSANQIKKYDEALESLSVGLELVLNDPAVKAEFLGQMGDAYFGIKDFRLAIETYQRALKTDPSSLLLKNNFAIKLANYNLEFELAISLITQAIQGAPGQPQFIDTHGWVLFRQKNYSEAHKQFLKAFEIDQQDKLILEHLGDAEALLGNVDKALEFWEKAQNLGAKSKILQKKITDNKYYEPEF